VIEEEILTENSEEKSHDVPQEGTVVSASSLQFHDPFQTEISLVMKEMALLPSRTKPVYLIQHM
jgi:hypothetical protein